MKLQRKSIVEIRQMKGAQRISCLTAYDCVTAAILDRAGCDILLVGDSLGNVVLGYETTLPVTMADMIRHTGAVVRGSEKSLIVADLPFLSYQSDRTRALDNAGRLLSEGGAGAVKLEGGKRNFELIQQLVEVGIPVMGHIGMMPQSVHALGGYRRLGKTVDEQRFLLEEAQAIESAGAFSIVLECIHSDYAKEISNRLTIPTIGIGSGEHCDGQVLVINDLLGYSITPPPGFVKPQIDLAAIVGEAASNYIRKLKESC